MSSYYPDAGIGEIDVLRVDEYEKGPGCLDGRRHPARPANTVIQEALHVVMNVPLTSSRAC
jgi:hypothetical protein